jgi:hypothetical protein
MQMSKPQKQTSSLAAQVKAARRVSVPILAITTPDPAATMDLIDKATNGDKPKLTWDIVEGVRSRNESGHEERAKIISDFDPTIGNPVAALTVAKKMSEGSILYVHLTNRWLADAQFVQAAWNIRDEFKRDHRTLILLGPSIDLPPELAGDVVVLDEPLPDADALAVVVREQHQNASLKVDDDTVGLAVEAVQGLPSFQAEQVVAMSLGPSGISIDALWERKRRQIELTPGLKVNREGVKFGDIGGVKVIKDFMQRIANGQARPNAVIFLDEIEKAMGGSSGDTSGVSQDQLGAILSYMQDQQAAGCIFVGPPGAAKSAVAKAVGCEAGIPTIQLDLGALKGSLVGQSEQNLRAALKVITSVSNGRSLWIATCNAIADLPPELRRRFTLGTFFFDLPSKEERAVIWQIWTKKYSLAAKELPDDEGWTGAEIRQACDIAWRLGCSLRDAAAFVVPVSRSAAEQIERLRKGAEGRFLSASHPGVYRQNASPSTATKTSTRKLSLED